SISSRRLLKFTAGADFPEPIRFAQTQASTRDVPTDSCACNACCTTMRRPHGAGISGELVYHKSCLPEPPPIKFVHTHLTVLSRKHPRALNVAAAGTSAARTIAQRRVDIKCCDSDWPWPPCSSARLRSFRLQIAPRLYNPALPPFIPPAAVRRPRTANV